MTYYIEHENKIVLCDNDKTKLQATLTMMPQYAACQIQETDRPIVDFEFADTPQYQAKSAAAEKAARIAELQGQLDVLDLKAIRALRAISAGTGAEADSAKLAELEEQAAEIRRRIQEL